ncbi:MAG TPA: hypothetical protein VF669_13795 [Tepidisphaeraceae bacterium]
MSRSFMLIALMIFGCTSAPAQQQTAAPPPPPPAQGAAPQPAANIAADQSDVDAILDRLDRRGKNLTDFTADVRLQEDDEAVGTSIVRTGKVLFQKLPGDDARMRMSLDKKEVRGKTRDEKLEYVYAGGWLTDRDYGRKTNKRRQVVRPGEKINLLKLGEGPFPLPLGQDKADVHRMFDVKKINRAQDDPANGLHLQLTPKADSRYAKKFDAIDFWVDPTSDMPVRVRSTEGDQIRTWDLSNIKVNVGMADRDFELPAVDEKQWQMDEAPYDQR